MPSMTDRQSVAANATVVNVLAGKLHEFLSAPSTIRLYGTASAVGLNVTFIVGSEVLLQDQEINSQNRLPIVPDDFTEQGFGNTGERILVSLRNTTAGAITGFTRVDIEALQG